MLTVTINDRKIVLEAPVTILEAARKNGIDIPTLCHHPVLELWGGCRMCLVEVEKMPRLQTACTVKMADGMAVRTETPRVAAARKAVLEFLLINHPLDCPTCDKAGICSLQDLTVKYGAVAGRFEEGKRVFPESVDDPVIVRNMKRCIMCTRCVRMCEGVQGASAIGVINRGAKSHVEPLSGGRYNCEYCGNCLSVCPVGAVMSRLHRYTYRPWQMEKTVKTVCGYCGTGCTLRLEVRDESIKRVSADFEEGVNKGLLCNRGRFGYGYVDSTERLKTPLIRRGDKLEPTTWSEALGYAAEKLLEIKKTHGGAAIGGIAGGRNTNEEIYLFQKLLRAGLGSNNIDSIARMGLLPAQQILEGIFGQGAAANIISGISRSDAVLVVATDPTQVNPVMGLQVRAAANAGKKVVTIGHMHGLRRHRTHSLEAAAGQEAMVLAGLLNELLKVKTLPGENAELEAAIKGLAGELPSAHEAAGAAGIPASSITEAASALKDVSTSSIIVGRELAASVDMKANMALLAAAGYVLNSRMFIASERPNEQGLVELGCAPDLLPGDRPLEVRTFREKCEEAWGAPVSEKPGLTLMEMIEGAGDTIKAMYVMGEDPAFNLPGRKRVKEALGRLELLIVQEIFMTDTAMMADVVFPALAWSEKEGTYTNLEKRIQKLERALARDGVEDWKILAEIASRTGLKSAYKRASDVLKEIALVSPVHAGLSFEAIGEDGLMWPYMGKPLGAGGRFSFSGVSLEAVRGGAQRQKQNGLRLVLDKPLFHSGTLSTRSGALMDIMDAPSVRMAPGTAEKRGIGEGDSVKVSSALGEIRLKASLEDGLPEEVLFISNNFREAGAFELFGYELEPESKTPVLTVRGLKVERL